MVSNSCMLWGAACGMTWADLLGIYEKACDLILNKLKAMYILLSIGWHLDRFQTYIHKTKFTELWKIGSHEQSLGNPGGGLDEPTGRDQRCWVFRNNPQKYFATNRKPKKILCEKQNPKKHPKKHYSFRKSQAWYDNNGDQWLLKHLVNKTGTKILLNIWNEHFKIRLLFNSPKIQQLWPVLSKNANYRNSKPKKILCWPLSVNMPSPPLGWVIGECPSILGVIIDKLASLALYRRRFSKVFVGLPDCSGTSTR